MLVKAFEEKVLEIEGIVIIIRCDTNTEVPNYPYNRSLAGKYTTTQFKEIRLSHLLPGHEYIILGGDLKEPHGNMRLDTLRDSYKK